MNISQMKVAITKVYPNDSWRKKVEFMPTDQVVAIYYKFLESGKFNEVASRPVKPEPEYEQISIFDLRELYATMAEIENNKGD